MAAVLPNCPAGFLDYNEVDKRGNLRIRRKTLNRKRLPKGYMCLHLILVPKQKLVMIHLLEEWGELEGNKLGVMRRVRIDADLVKTSFHSSSSYSKLNSDFFKLLYALRDITKAQKIEYNLLNSNSKRIELKIVMPQMDIPYPFIYLQQLLFHVAEKTQPPK